MNRERFGQLMALGTVYFVLVAGMAITVAWHDVLFSFLGSLGGVGAFFVVALSLGAFVGVIWYCFVWVRTQAHGMFRI